MKHFTTRDTRAQQSGYVLPMALLLVVLAAIILTSVTTAISRKWNAVEQELFVQQELMTYNPATALLDLCMARLASQPSLSNICGYGANTPTTDGWTTVDGTSGCDDGTHGRCWRVIDVDTENVRLVSDVGNRELVELQIQIAVDCFGAIDMERDCGRLGLIERRYYRNTFLQYQVHYDRQEFSPGVLHANPDDPDLVGAQQAFVTGDVFNGPIRLNASSLLHCGDPAPSFTRVALLAADPSDPDGFKPIDPDCDLSQRRTPSGVVDRENARLSVIGSNCVADDVLPVIATPDGNGWADRDYPLDTDATVSLTHPDPNTGEATENLSSKADHVVVHDSRVPSFDESMQEPRESAAAITVQGTLQHAEQSVVVVATGDIIVSGDLMAPDDGLIALISQCGDVLIQPDLSGATCLDSTLHATHSITLKNVAVLAPNGSMWMPDWETPRCASGGIPTFTFEGSVSSGYMGLHGEAGNQGVPTTGWSKVFTYPTDDTATPNVDESFWLRRPLWWPRMSDGEWLPLDA